DRLNGVGADRADHDVNAVLLDQLLDPGPRGLLAVTLVDDGGLDLVATELAAVGVQVDLPAAREVIADGLVDARLRPHQAGVDWSARTLLAVIAQAGAGAAAGGQQRRRREHCGQPAPDSSSGHGSPRFIKGWVVPAPVGTG